MSDELLDIIKSAKGRCWINGREPNGQLDDTLCIRLWEEDRLRIERALTPWWQRVLQIVKGLTHASTDNH